MSAAIDRIKFHLKKDKIRSKFIIFKRIITVIYSSVLDSSCGDMTWMPSFLSSRSDVLYTGYDIVEENIKNHREKFRETDWKFEVHDIVIYDLVVIRHTTMHLKISDVMKVIRNFLDSSSKFLLTTSFPKENVRFHVVTYVQSQTSHFSSTRN